MKKRILALLLSAVLVVNVGGCNLDCKNDTDELPENTDIDASNSQEADDNTENKEPAEIKPPRKSPRFYNGVWYNPGVTYTFAEIGVLSVYIADWDEDHIITSLSDEQISAFKYSVTAACVNNDKAFLVLKSFDEPKIAVVSFEKGSQAAAVRNLDIDDIDPSLVTIESRDVLSVDFINGNEGYIFVFKEVIRGYHSRGSTQLYNLLKTEDGGNTWNSINIEHAPLLNAREPVMFAKMASEDVGIISGEAFAADYNFCERTLLTTDGGLHWVNITGLPQINDLYAAKIIDFKADGDSYILTVRPGNDGTGNEGTEYIYTYRFVDLNTWILINN